MAIVEHLTDLALEHNESRDKGDGIGNHHGSIVDDVAIEAPTGDSDAEQQIHPQRDRRGVPCPYGFDRLGKKTQGRQRGGQVTEQSDSWGMGHGKRKHCVRPSCRMQRVRPRAHREMIGMKIILRELQDFPLAGLVLKI